MSLSETEARALLVRAFERVGLAEAAAQDAAEILTLAEMMGISTHGLNRVSGYADRIAAGGIDPQADIMVSAPAPAIRHLNGQNGLGPAVARRALAEAIDAEGRPTTNPAQAMRGLMQAIGWANCANLALWLDLLVGVISGAAMLSGNPPTAKTPGAKQDLGQLFLLIDTRQLLPDAVLSDRMRTANRTVMQSPPVDPDDPVRIPGGRAIRALQNARIQGLNPAPNVLAGRRALAGD